MGRKSKDELTPISKAVIDVCRDLLGNWGGKATDFFKKSGISQNYWYKRMRYEMPFNTSDIDMIAQFFGTTSLAIYEQASQRAHNAQIDGTQLKTVSGAMEQLQAKAGWKPKFEKVAYTDPNKRQESETPND